MRFLTPRFTSVLALLSLLAPAMQSATLRGRLRCKTGAASGVAVTLSSPQLGKVGTFFTGGDGMFYFNVPPGRYVLKLWYSRKASKPDEVHSIVVTEPTTDLPSHFVPVCYPR